MENKYFSLGTIENNGLVKVFRIVFGIVCFAIAIFWLIFNIRSLKADATLWLTIIFLTGFGFYQVWSGLGRAIRFIEIGTDHISLKKNPILGPVNMPSQDIDRIELFPFNVVFFLKEKKRILLRFGTSDFETNEKVKDEILSFAEKNNIPLEIIEEKL